jgi:hypothetical protein
MNMYEIGIKLSRPKRIKGRGRAGEEFPHAGDTGDGKLSVLVLGTEASVGDEHAELHLIDQTIANLFKNSFHSADNGIVKFSQL